MLACRRLATLSFVTLALASPACLEHRDPACQDVPARSADPTGELYVGRADPYAPGPLSVRTISVARCEAGAPVALLIHTPETAGTYAVVVFQHGFLARNSAYTEILRALASHGFIVVAPQMYTPGLPAVLGCPTAAAEADHAAQLLAWLPGHLDDLTGQRARTDRLGLAGHSRGGKVAWLVLVADPARAQAIAGVDPVDGTGGPRGNQARVVNGPFSFARPALVIGTGLGGNCAPAGDNHEQFYAASAAPAWHVVVPDAGHADMLDADSAAASLGTLVCTRGTDPAAMRRLTAGLLTAFFRASLQGDTTASAYLTDTDAAPLPIEVESK